MLFNWKHFFVVAAVLTLAVVVARDQMFIPPFLIVVPALMGLAVGAIARTLGAGGGGFFFVVFAGILCWLNPVFVEALPTMLIGMSLGTMLGRGLVAVPVVTAAVAPVPVAPPQPRGYAAQPQGYAAQPYV